MKKHIRNSLAIGAAMLSAGTAYAQVQVESVGTVQIHLTNPEALSKLSGEELREGLMKNLRIKPDSRVKEAQLYMAYVVDGKVKDVFISQTFKSDPKSLARNEFFPGEMTFPGDMYFPGEMTFPGNILLPGDMYYPESDRKEAVSKAAISSFARTSQKSGWFFIVIASEGIAKAGGVALPSGGK